MHTILPKQPVEIIASREVVRLQTFKSYYLLLNMIEISLNFLKQYIAIERLVLTTWAIKEHPIRSGEQEKKKKK